MADKDQTIDKIDFENVTIASSGTDSTEVDLQGMTLCGFYMPAAFTGTAMTFKAASSSGGTFLPVEDGFGVTISKTVSASKYIKVDPVDFSGVRFLKLVSGSAEGAERTITLAIRQV